MFNEYPYVNLQDVNLDWILKHIKELETNLQDFVKLNTIKYADPIIWNITKQYETNTVVIDGNTGTAYLSVQPVPAGVALTNTDYWTVIFTLNLTTSNQNITFRDDGTNVVATFASNTGDWILWNFYLYRVTQPIALNTAYVVGFNLERFSVELFIKDYINTLTAIIGDLDDLNTSDKASVVNAINSVLSDLSQVIGNLNDLTTSDTSSIVNAVNSLKSEINAIITDIGDLSDLTTGDTSSVVNAINEVNSKILVVTPEMFGAEGDGLTDDTTAVRAAVNAGDIIIMNNNYLITSSINVGSGKKIIGKGNIIVHDYMYTFVMSDNTSIEGLHFTDNTALENEWAHVYGFEVDNVSVANCTFDTIGFGYAVQFDHSTNLKINWNTIKNYSFSGIMLWHTCAYCDIIHNYIFNSRWRGNDHNYPISISGYTDHDYGAAHHIKCNFNYIEELAPWWEGIDSHGANNYEIIGNTIKNVYRGIALGYKRTGGTGFSESNCSAVIKNNDISIGIPSDPVTYPNSLGIYIASGDTTTTKCLSIENNRIKGTSYTDDNHEGVAAISVSLGDGEGKNIDIINNYIDVTNMTCIGIGARGRLNAVRIVGNYFNQLVGTNAVKYGIFFAYCEKWSGFEIASNVINPIILNDPTKARFIRGASSGNPPADNALAEYRNNCEHGFQIDGNDYINTPRAVLGVNTKSKGVTGQFVPSTAAGVAGWICQSANNWLAVAGTSV